MSLEKFAKAQAEKALKATQEEVAVATAKAPEAKLPKEQHKGIELNTPEIQRLRAVVNMAKHLRGGDLIDADWAAVKELARVKAPTLTTDITDTLSTGPTGVLLRDIWEEVSVSKLIPFREIPASMVGMWDNVEDDAIDVFMIGEGDDGDDSNESYTKMRYEVIKIMGVTRASYESLSDSVIDIAQEKLRGLIRGMAVRWEAAIINGDNTTLAHMDALDYKGNVYTAKSPERGFKGIRHLGLNKEQVDFTATALTDDELKQKIFDMVNAGGKYTDFNAINRGDCFLMMPQSTYSRIAVSDDFTDASKSGISSTLAGAPVVGTVAGVPVVISSYMPALTDTNGVVSGSAVTDLYGSMFLVNRQYLKAFVVQGSMLSENERNIINQTIVWTNSMRAGFNGIYDRTDSAGTVDAGRKYVVAGVGVALAKA